MKIGIAILCRHNSTRLPGKILKKINGRTVLSYIVERIKQAAPNNPIVVTTTIDKSDDPIVKYCRRAGLQVFRGDMEDVAGRLMSCAQTYKWDFVVRINGDNLFLDAEILSNMLAITSTNMFDFVSNVPGRTFPYGMSVEIIRTAFYQYSLEKMTKKSHREHVTLWLYENPEFGTRHIYTNTICPKAAGMKMALDTPADLKKAKTILDYGISAQRNLGLREIYNFINRDKVNSPWSGSMDPLLIAEIGGNHEGDFEVAKKMNKLAIESGVDCVKFQLYRGDTLVSGVESASRNQHFKKFELSQEQHLYLAQMCNEASVAYSASVWDVEMLDWIDPYLDFYKIGSGDMTAWPILEKFAIRAKPILLSTGLSTLDEVMQTVSFIQRINPEYHDPDMLCIMQCTSMYPIPDNDANLMAMDTIRKHTGCSVGYSDHTIGMEALLVATAMGASALEFHFTDSRKGKEFRDHKVSLTPNEILLLKKNISQITTLRGSGIKVPQSSELEHQHEVSFRRAAYLNCKVKAGRKILAEDLIYLRPAIGTDARDIEQLIGSTSLRDLQPFAALRPDIDYSLK